MSKKASSTRIPQKSTNREFFFVPSFVSIYLPTIFLFLIHRILVHPHLTSGVAPESHIRALFVGALSDVWVSFLLASIVASLTWLLRRAHGFSGNAVAIIFLLLTTLGLCAHQGYVEFFQFQIEPFHIRYLSDWQFVSSNAGSFVSPQNLVMILTAVIFVSLLFRKKKWSPPLKTAAAVYGMITIAALAAHNRNIHLRVQWFIPENLQNNFLETLYLRTKKQLPLEPLASQDFQFAAKFYGHTGQNPGKFNQTIFAESISINTELHPVATALADSFQGKIRNGQNPIILVVLLESVRPSETGLFSQAKPSLTPAIDALAADGIWFKNAFATGSVTRSGQEAVLCGNFSGRNNSLMRNFAALSYQCLTDEFQNRSAGLFWYHGGDGRFDGQEAFWRKHNVSDILTIDSFPPDTPGTGWGVGDKAFFKAAAIRLKTAHLGAGDRSKTEFMAGMMLSVTNHIPWALPADFSGPTNNLEPAFLTTTYTDQAIAELVHQLKKDGLWDSTLMIIVSDHGNKTEPYENIYEASRYRTQLLQSHINLILSGGVTLDALSALHDPPHTFDHYVGQSDVAATIAFITKLPDFKSMGKNLFSTASHFPVFTQTEDGLYIPSLDRLIPYSNMTGKLQSRDSGDWIFRFHYIAATEFLRDLIRESR